MSKLVVTLIVYNEAHNIRKLIKKILSENFPSFKLLIYTDGSTDGTAEIVSEFRKRYSNKIIHVKSRKNRGKVQAFNEIFNLVKKYEIAIFLDGDIHFRVGTLRRLFKYLENNTKLKAATPLFSASIDRLHGLHKSFAHLYSLARLHTANQNKHRFLSGRTYAIKTAFLTKIPEKGIGEDMYLNLTVPYDSIGICKKALVLSKRPQPFADFFIYHYRLGKSLGAIKRLDKNLWNEQIKRLSVWEYAWFDTANYKFAEFFSALSIRDKFVFIFSRLVAGTAMYVGFFTQGSKSNKTWTRLRSTKTKF